MALTRRQREVLEVIRAFIQKNGYSPSLEEIGGALGLSSVATVHKHVSHLVDKGLVRRVWNQNRSIELVDESTRKPCIEIPITGVLSAGRAVVSLIPPEVVAVPPDVAAGRSRLFALRVSGDALTAQKLCDGDLLVLEDRRTPRDGETVLAFLGSNDPVLRRIEREGSRFKLSAVHDAAPPQLVSAERVELLGVIVALFRRYATEWPAAQVSGPPRIV